MDPLELVIAWHEAVNAADVAAAATLVHDDVEVGGPRGSAHGRAVHDRWLTDSGIDLEVVSYLQRGPTVVVAQTATWPDPSRAGLSRAGSSGAGPSGAGPSARTEPVPVATVFTVVGARIQRIVRYDDVDAALQAAGIRQPPAGD